MPCNGRFPLLLTMIALLGAGGGVWAGLPMENPVLSSLLTALVLIGIAIGVSAPVILSLVRKKREAGADGKGDPS